MKNLGFIKEKKSKLQKLKIFISRKLTDASFIHFRFPSIEMLYAHKKNWAKSVDAFQLDYPSFFIQMLYNLQNLRK